jgi:predicted hotdog family 3-hydroxylacyl-ACP dehydratase
VNLAFPLDHAAIAARVPHAGSMCLLATCESATAGEIVCTVTGHADPAHPLRTAHGLLAVNAIEMASQAMALHGMLAAAPGTPPRRGFLASVRGVTLHVARLDTAAGQPLAEGRATVILQAPP